MATELQARRDEDIRSSPWAGTRPMTIDLTRKKIDQRHKRQDDEAGSRADKTHDACQCKHNRANEDAPAREPDNVGVEVTVHQSMTRCGV